MIRLGIVGAGTMGAAHASSIGNLPDATLVAVADADAEKARKTAEAFKAECVSDPGGLAARDDIDAVIVATPTPFHFSHAKMALDQGKHVLIEMPMVRHAHEGEELIKLAKQKGRLIAVNHLQRFFMEYEMIKQQVDGGQVGKPGMIRLGRKTPHPKSWYSNFESSGGVILDAMTHELDFLLWTFGPVKRVYALSMQDRRSTETLDYALLSLRMESGAIAHIESSWCHYGQFVLDVEVAGDKGLIRYGNQDAIPLQISILDETSGGRRYVSESPVIYPAHYRLLRGFVDAVQGKAENPLPPEHALDAVKVALAAIESARQKRPVILNGN